MHYHRPRYLPYHSHRWYYSPVRNSPCGKLGGVCRREIEKGGKEMSKHVPAKDWILFNAELDRYAHAPSHGFRGDIRALEEHIQTLKQLAPRLEGSAIHWQAEQHIQVLEQALTITRRAQQEHSLTQSHPAK